MFSIQSSNPDGGPDAGDEKKRARDMVVGNVITFGMLCLLIRAVPYALQQFPQQFS